MVGKGLTTWAVKLKLMTMTRMDLVRTIACLCVLITLWSSCGSQCPSDTAIRAQQCISNLTWGVAPAPVDNNGNNVNGDVGSSFGDSSIHRHSGSMSKSQAVNDAISLDYRKIREYCAEDGHMLRFVHCVEELSQHCPDLPPDGAFGQLLNPERVRTSVPNLCSNQNEIEEKSECMNKAMNHGHPCKDRAYNSIRSGSHRRASDNNTATFFLQCRFFSALAECQRMAISETCGGDLGDLHADFLLSFVPAICLSDPLHVLPQNSRYNIRRQGHRHGDTRKDLGHADHQNKAGLHSRNEGHVNARWKNEAEERHASGDGFMRKELKRNEGQQFIKGKMPERSSPQQGIQKPGREFSSLDEDATQQVSGNKQTTALKTSPIQQTAVSVSQTSISEMLLPVSDSAGLELTSEDAKQPNSHVSCLTTTPSSKTSATATIAPQEVFSLALSVVTSLAMVFI